MSWAAVVVVLSGGNGAVNLPEELVVVTSRFGSVWDGGPSAFLLLLAFCSRFSSLVYSVRVLSCSLWVAGNVWRILNQSPKCLLNVI